MKDTLFQAIKEFLHLHLKGDDPILLGFSGGTDSLALLHLLLDYQKLFPLNIHVAHVDHGWRPESGQESQQLRDYVKEKNLPFHCHRIQDLPKGENLEEYFRFIRLEFFKRLYDQKKCQALLLGHQADDQAETVLKRILEGANLISLGGIKEETVLYGMKVLRPLLSFSKKKLTAWAFQKGLNPIEDETNRDPKYLRARMRLNLFPYLEREFGKSSIKNLGRFAKRFQELEMYLEKQTQGSKKGFKKFHWGYFLSAQDLSNFEKIEIEYLIRKLLKKERITPSYDALKKVFELVSSGKIYKKVVMQSMTFIVDPQGLLILKSPVPQWEGLIPLKSGQFQFGKWTWTIQCRTQQVKNHKAFTDWSDLLNGSVHLKLPKGEYTFGFHKASKREKALKHFPIPKFFLEKLPLIWKDDQIVLEALLEQGVKRETSEGEWMSVVITVDHV